MTRRTTVGLAMLAVLAAGGCGGSSEDDAAEPVKTYLSALANGDGEKACDQLAGEFQRELVADAVEAGGDLTTCADAVATTQGIVGPDEEEAFRNPEVQTEVRGDRATVSLPQARTSLDLVKSGDRWLITGLRTGLEASLGSLNECFAEAEGDARVQGDDCFSLTKDEDTSWDDRVREFGDCVRGGRDREDCY